MNAEQRASVVRYLSNGAKLREAAAMVEAPWGDFSADWVEGRKDSDAGKDSPEATFYTEAHAARARHIAETRAEAKASVGSRESADILAYVKALESEAEPLATSDDEGPISAPRLIDHPDRNVREAAQAVQTSSRLLLRALAGTPETQASAPTSRA